MTNEKEKGVLHHVADEIAEGAIESWSRHLIACIEHLLEAYANFADFLARRDGIE